MPVWLDDKAYETVLKERAWTAVGDWLHFRMWDSVAVADVNILEAMDEIFAQMEESHARP